MQNTPICIWFTGFATVISLLLLTNIDDKSLTDVWFTRVHQYLLEKGGFPSVNQCAECQVQWNVDEGENIIDRVDEFAHWHTENNWCYSHTVWEYWRLTALPRQQWLHDCHSSATCIRTLFVLLNVARSGTSSYMQEHFDDGVLSLESETL
jgi:hypothetical protein